MFKTDTRMWLRRYGLMEVLSKMIELSVKYNFGWADHWNNNMDKLKWLKSAVSCTYKKISDADKAAVRADYDLWQWLCEHCDVDKMDQCNALLAGGFMAA